MWWLRFIDQGSFYLINCRRNRNAHHEYSIRAIPNPSIMLPRERVQDDLDFVYHKILFPCFEESAELLLNSIHFVKEFPPYTVRRQRFDICLSVYPSLDSVS